MSLISFIQLNVFESRTCFHLKVCCFRVFTWGWGVFGQLGHRSVEDLSEPKLVEALKDKVCQLRFVFGGIGSKRLGLNLSD